MLYLDKFMPDIYNNLTKEEKVDLINDFANEIFEELNIEPIGIIVDGIPNNEKKLGQFVNFPAYILVNDLFINPEKAATLFKSNSTANDFIPYFLVNTIAHECYHYYQYCIVKKLINNELTSQKEKEEAYLYFIGIYEKIFASFCKKKDIAIEDNLTEDIIYRFSPVEISANDFAYSIVELYKNIPNVNKDVFLTVLLNSGTLSSDIEGNSVEEFKRDQVIEHCLNVALAFLNYKNKNSGLKAKYLDIDETELESSIKSKLKSYNQTNQGLERLLKKLNKK